ncbi:hypothetical protein WME97_03515 [Sorangium sp. So ce367]|uniref:hypothetical protein n=1 Tax=Sorangium sp. So ce367 TaxID=3133305 RepID=UPI003F63E20A
MVGLPDPQGLTRLVRSRAGPPSTPRSVTNVVVNVYVNVVVVVVVVVVVNGKP